MKLCLIRNDGHISIMNTVKEYDLTNLNHIKEIEELIQKYNQSNMNSSYMPHIALSWHKVKDEDLNMNVENRDFRMALVYIDGNIKHDMNKCREIHMGRIREMRNKRLNELDIDLIKAQDQENNTKVSEIRILKQQLRDIPQIFDLSMCHDLNSLRNRWPVNIEKHPIYQGK